MNAVLDLKLKIFEKRECKRLFLCSVPKYCTAGLHHYIDTMLARCPEILVVHYFFRIQAQSFFATHFCTVNKSRYILTGVHYTAVSWMDPSMSNGHVFHLP
jgi:hypothetical protein